MRESDQKPRERCGAPRTKSSRRQGGEGAPVLHPLTLIKLEDALAHAGCPVCWEMDRSTRRYLRGLLREDKGAEGVWERLRQNWGLCHPHTRRLLAEEAETIPGFSTATLYRSLIDALLSRARGGGSGSHRLARRAFRALLRPEGGCFACEQLGDYERAVIGGLVETLTAGEPPTIRETYVQGDGLCLPHLRIALDRAGNSATADLLRERFQSRLESLAAELEAFVEAHTPNGSEREKSDSDVWLRAVEQFAGRVARTEE